MDNVISLVSKKDRKYTPVAIHFYFPDGDYKYYQNIDKILMNPLGIQVLLKDEGNFSREACIMFANMSGYEITWRIEDDDEDGI